MDWVAFFRSDEFREYRRRQVEMVANCIASDLRKGDISKVPTLLETAKAMLALCEVMTDCFETKQLLAAQRQEDIAGVTKILMKRYMEEP